MSQSLSGTASVPRAVPRGFLPAFTPNHIRLPSWSHIRVQLAVEGNNGPMIETRSMWRSRLCPFVQCRCENQQLVPKARKERHREQTTASLWLYQTENMTCDTLIMMLFLRQITGGQLANCDRCYTNSSTYDSISTTLDRIRGFGEPRRHPSFKKTRITEGPFRIYIQKGLITDIWYLR